MKNHTNILGCIIFYVKALIGTKVLRIRFNQIDRVIRV